ncbi:MAG: DUF4831 family protein [Muribaculaceae bacterium]|nr:DUF4831 family protein [Muribaculaceae bacterium]
MKTKFTITAVAFLTAMVAVNAQNTQKLSATKANDYALVYTLPNTVLDITFETEYTEKQPGELALYARKYLNIDDVILQPSSSVVIKSVTVVPRGVANTDKRYAVKFGAGNLPYMIIGEQNQPISVNTQKGAAVQQPTLPKPRAAQPTPLEVPAAQQAISPDMARSTSTAKRAELAAESIFSIRESRNDILTGNSDQKITDGKALSLILDNLSAQEAALTAMFVGTTKTFTRVNTVTFVPTEPEEEVVLARLSPIEGLLDADDLSGAPIYLKINVTDPGKMPVDDKGKELPFPKNGFAYAIPSTANVSIEYDGRTIWNGEEEIAQFGIVYGLNPGSFSDKKAPVYVVLDPATGGIKEMGAVEQ